MTKAKAAAVGVSALALLSLLTASAVSAQGDGEGYNRTKNHSERVAKALGKQKFVVTKGEVLTVDPATRIVTARVKNSNRKDLRGSRELGNTIVHLYVAQGAAIRVGDHKFLKVENLNVNGGDPVDKLSKVLPGDTLLMASGVVQTIDGAQRLFTKKLYVKRTKFQINESVTAVDTAVDPDTVTGTVGSASKNTGLTAGGSATVEVVSGAKVKRNGVTATLADVVAGDLGIIKGYITLESGVKVFNATELKFKSAEFIVNENENENSNGNSNTNS